MKKYIITFILVILIAVSVVITEYRAEQGIVVDDISIEANGRILAAVEAKPEGLISDGSLPAVAVFHGFTANKEMMRPFIEGLARVGFYVIAVDQQGHGQSSGNLREDGVNSLRDDGIYVINFIRSQSIVDTDKVGILGHSMGAGTAIATSVEVGDLGSTVLLGNSLSNIQDYNVSPSFPANVLMGIGKYDELFTVNDAETSFEHMISGSAQINTLYGDFDAGTARELLVTSTDHILEVINPTLVERSIEWLYQSLRDSTVTLDSSELDSVNGWRFIFDQFSSLLSGLLILSLIPVIFWVFPQENREEEGEIPWISHGIVSFISFFIAIPFFLVIGGSFVSLFAIWFILGGLFYTFLQARRNNQGFSVYLKNSLYSSKDLYYSVSMFIILFAGVHAILYFVHWDFRYVLPLLSALNFRRLGLFVLIFLPAVFFFMMELKSLSGYKQITISQFIKELSARIWSFTLLLLIHYLPIIIFQVTLLPTIIGFLAFFIVGLLPVMIILTFISSFGRAFGWSHIAIAIISAGLISWMLASTLSFI